MRRRYGRTRLLRGSAAQQHVFGYTIHRGDRRFAFQFAIQELLAYTGDLAVHGFGFVGRCRIHHQQRDARLRSLGQAL